MLCPSLRSFQVDYTFLLWNPALLGAKHKDIEALNID